MSWQKGSCLWLFWKLRICLLLITGSLLLKHLTQTLDPFKFTNVMLAMILSCEVKKRPTSGLSLYSTYTLAKVQLKMHYCCGPLSLQLRIFPSLCQLQKRKMEQSRCLSKLTSLETAEVIADQKTLNPRFGSLWGAHQERHAVTLGRRYHCGASLKTASSNV